MKNKKKYDSVQMMRELRNKIDSEINNLSKDELKIYFNKKKKLFESKYGRKTTVH